MWVAVGSGWLPEMNSNVERLGCTTATASVATVLTVGESGMYRMFRTLRTLFGKAVARTNS